MYHKRSLLLLLLGVFLLVGCSTQDDPTQPGNTEQSLSAIIRGEISEKLIAFEFAAEVGEGIEDQGALLVRGRNVAYDEEQGVLSVDLAVYNDSENAYPEPVGLTFMHFIPEGVTIMNPDNDQNGAGALVMFEFEDGDDSWSPGEESLSRTVHFVVDSGVSIGFVARIDVAMAPEGGTIGGMVWHDMNENGEIDTDEKGVGGVGIVLHAGTDTTAAPLTSVMTADDGSYRFRGQDAGYYTVVRMPVEGAAGTTPPRMEVILVEMDGTVSDFLIANFGLKRAGDPGDDFVKVGDYVHAKGWYAKDPKRLESELFNVTRCDGEKHDDDDDHDGDDDGDDCDDCEDEDEDCDGDCDDEDGCDNGDCDHGCRENACWGRLAGPLTAVNLDKGYIKIMGTKVHFSDKDKPERDWKPGIRVRVDAYRDEDVNDGKVMACKFPKWWNGNRDRVRGFVQEVVKNDDGRITGVVILNTLVTVPRHETR